MKHFSAARREVGRVSGGALRREWLAVAAESRQSRKSTFKRFGMSKQMSSRLATFIILQGCVRMPHPSLAEDI